jgi:hypothetical protein
MPEVLFPCGDLHILLNMPVNFGKVAGETGLTKNLWVGLPILRRSRGLAFASLREEALDLYKSGVSGAGN